MKVFKRLRVINLTSNIDFRIGIAEYIMTCNYYTQFARNKIKMRGKRRIRRLEILEETFVVVT